MIISDDASADDTFEQGRLWAERWAARPGSPGTLLVRHTKNLGYGGNQKSAYRLAAERGLDIVVLLHGDGQYAPESLPDLVGPLERGEADAVFGSRMMIPGAARRGGMPLYKRVGNRVLTGLQNAMLGSSLSEFHSGFRAYLVSALQEVPFEANSDGFDFDTQVIVQLLHAGKRIVEVPIPTYYGDEICYVDGVKYARAVLRDTAAYKLAVVGFGAPEWVPPPDEYAFKEGDGSSHAVLLDMLAGLPAQRILDLGCSAGLLAERARALGHTVTGVDFIEHPGVRDRVDEFHRADLERGIPKEAGEDFDLVIAGDVIEHLTDPRAALEHMRQVLRPDGQVLLSVPNVGHWYPRTRVALGRFGYDRRGILDETHLRFFTRRTLVRMVRQAGFDVLEQRATGLPLGAVTPGEGGGRRALRRVDAGLVAARPTLFGYQHVLRLTPHAHDVVRIEVNAG